jgi:cell division protein FtsL
MNAAARALTQGSLATAQIRFFTLSRQALGLILLLIAVLGSALSVVYVTAQDRQLFSDLQGLRQAHDALSVESGQLLLEQNTWATPARVQLVAQQQLGMVVPATNAITTVTMRNNG